MAALIAITIALVGGALGAGAILTRPQPPAVVAPSPPPRPAPSTVPVRGSLGHVPRALVARWLGVPGRLPGLESTDDPYLEIEGTSLRMRTRSIDGVMTEHLNATAGADGTLLAIQSLIGDACPEDVVGELPLVPVAGRHDADVRSRGGCVRRARCNPRRALVSPGLPDPAGLVPRRPRCRTAPILELREHDGRGRHLAAPDGDAGVRGAGRLANSMDFVGGYWLEPTTWHDGFVDARGGVDDGQRTVAKGIYVLSAPVASPAGRGMPGGHRRSVRRRVRR